MLAAVALLGGGIASATPAHADQWVYDDAAGDVTHTVETDTSISVVPEPERQNGDVAQVVVKHKAKKIKVKIRTRTKLEGEDDAEIGLYTNEGMNGLFWSWTPGFGQSGVATFACPGFRASLSDDRDTLRFSVPRSCLDNPRWVRVGALVRTYDPMSEEAFEDDGLRTATTLYGEPAKSPKVRR